ncbi:hypothetical protein [Maribacter sp. 2210JD10-5]|uniref:hypothetical protein n=1 Tax=Maribacter sp. 2210JD10-5 TaxID=3386272 RepID=UPI0039BCDD4F
MKKILTFLLIFICNFQSGFAQESQADLLKFLQTELKTGNHTFQIMTNQVVPSKQEKPLLIDGNGKILDSEFDIEFTEYIPVLEFKTAGSIKLKIDYKDSLFTIEPIENSFCPVIKINLKSNNVFINNDMLCYKKEISIKNKANVFESEWNGYQWWSNSSNESLKINPRFTVGKIKKNNNLYIEILWIQNGKKMRYRLLT